ncbi:unnamed protein product [Nesidiocoris tenuis]|uniref:Uncharacterized protein n=1 Tax=Nesidiocoris tenuis TaxID=355587 RepID=A0A6H5HU48_9HEMI|nr:unnamed protein product [Nesidiocoris tenuis]
MEVKSNLPRRANRPPCRVQAKFNVLLIREYFVAVLASFTPCSFCFPLILSCCRRGRHSPVPKSDYPISEIPTKIPKQRNVHQMKLAGTGSSGAEDGNRSMGLALGRSASDVGPLCPEEIASRQNAEVLNRGRTYVYCWDLSNDQWNREVMAHFHFRRADADLVRLIRIRPVGSLPTSSSRSEVIIQII